MTTAPPLELEAIAHRVKEKSSTYVEDSLILVVAECAALSADCSLEPPFPYIRFSNYVGKVDVHWAPGRREFVSFAMDDTGRRHGVDLLVMRAVALRQARLKLVASVDRWLMHGASAD